MYCARFWIYAVFYIYSGNKIMNVVIFRSDIPLEGWVSENKKKIIIFRKTSVGKPGMHKDFLNNYKISSTAQRSCGNNPLCIFDKSLFQLVMRFERPSPRPW